MKNSSLLLILLAFSICITGCGKGSKGPKTVKIKGVLQVRGEVGAEGIGITLIPEGEGLKPASGTTNAKGEFEFFTGNTGTPGVMPGTYKVVLRDVPTGGADEELMGMNSGEAEDGSGGTSFTEAVSDKFPERFLKADTSDVTVTVSKKDLKFEIVIPE